MAKTTVSQFEFPSKFGCDNFSSWVIFFQGHVQNLAHQICLSGSKWPKTIISQVEILSKFFQLGIFQSHMQGFTHLACIGGSKWPETTVSRILFSNWEMFGGGRRACKCSHAPCRISVSPAWRFWRRYSTTNRRTDRRTDRQTDRVRTTLINLHTNAQF